MISVVTSSNSDSLYFSRAQSINFLNNIGINEIKSQIIACKINFHQVLIERYENPPLIISIILNEFAAICVNKNNAAKRPNIYNIKN